MKRHSITLSFDVRQNEDSEQRYIRINLNQGCVQEFCLLLCLLFHRLIDEAIIIGKNHGYRMILHHSSHKKQPPRANVGWEANGLALDLSSNEVEHWMYFLLRYYRDGEAEVDHIDIEATSRRQSEKASTITFVFPDSKPPISSEEMRRRLEM